MRGNMIEWTNREHYEGVGNEAIKEDAISVVIWEFW